MFDAKNPSAYSAAFQSPCSGLGAFCGWIPGTLSLSQKLWYQPRKLVHHLCGHLSELWGSLATFLTSETTVCIVGALSPATPLCGCWELCNEIMKANRIWHVSPHVWAQWGRECSGELGFFHGLILFFAKVLGTCLISWNAMTHHC